MTSVRLQNARTIHTKKSIIFLTTSMIKNNIKKIIFVKKNKIFINNLTEGLQSFVF